MNKPYFLVIEGIDWSWKTTQVKELKEYFEKKWKKVLLLDYPRYNDESCITVKRYLHWEYWDIDSVSIYQSSMFYAMDRLDNYLKNLKNFWNQYDIVLANRYTTSNLIHQGSKLLKNLDEKWYLEDEIITKNSMFEFKEWLENLEYRDLGIPQPNKVIFLNVPEEISLKNVITRGNTKDLHENIEHLKWAYKSALFYVENIPTWNKINCVNEKWEMKSISEITNSILKELSI